MNKPICPICKKDCEPVGGVVRLNLTFFKCFDCGYRPDETYVKLPCGFNVGKLWSQGLTQEEYQKEFLNRYTVESVDLPPIEFSGEMISDEDFADLWTAVLGGK